MRSPSFVSGATVWAAILRSGVEISPFDDARDPRAGDACPQRLPPRRTPGASQFGLPPLRPYPARSSAPTRPAAPAWDRRFTPPRAPKLRSGLKLSLDPARRFGPVGNMRRAVHPPAWPWQDIAPMRSRAAGRGKISPRCVPEGASDGKSTGSWQHIACMYSNTANFGKICAPCIQKAPQSAVGEYTARTSCRQGALSPSEALRSCTARKSCHPLMDLALVQG